MPTVHQTFAIGIVIFAARVDMARARKLVGKSEPITHSVLLEAKRRCDVKALAGTTVKHATYFGKGEFLLRVLSLSLEKLSNLRLLSGIFI